MKNEKGDNSQFDFPIVDGESDTDILTGEDSKGDN